MKPLHIDDDKIQEAIQKASSTACQVLDDTFPGKEKSGISSNFQGLLVEILGRMLAGTDPLAGSKGYATELPRLILTDSSFGDWRQRGDAYVVVKPTPVSDPALVLNDKGTRFVPLDTPDEVDPFTSFEAAASGAMGYLKREGGEIEFIPEIRSVLMTDTGYILTK